jgi:hypothetical protein
MKNVVCTAAGNVNDELSLVCNFFLTQIRRRETREEYSRRAGNILVTSAMIFSVHFVHLPRFDPSNFDEID